MTILESATGIAQIIQSFSSIIWIILTIWGILYIGKSIKELIRYLPSLLEELERIKLRGTNRTKAIQGMKY